MIVVKEFYFDSGRTDATIMNLDALPSPEQHKNYDVYYTQAKNMEHAVNIKKQILSA